MLGKFALKLRSEYRNNPVITEDMRANISGVINAFTPHDDSRIYLSSLTYVVIMAPFGSDTYHNSLWELEYVESVTS